MVELLFSLLVAGAKIAASGTVGEFSKSAGKTAFESIKARLSKVHNAKSMTLLEDASDNLAYAAAVKADLELPSISQDSELLEMAETLRQALATLPPSIQAQYAIEGSSFESGKKILVEAVQGIRDSSFKSDGTIEVRDVVSPKK